MASAAALIFCFAVAGALASFGAGVVYAARALSGAHGAPNTAHSARWVAIVAWPFALTRLKAAGSAHARAINKALVAFMACLMIAAAAWSAAANLYRFAR